MKQRYSFRMPSSRRGWLGENDIDSAVDPIFSAGGLVKCRNYHMIGRGRLLKRQGWQRYLATQINSTAAVQGLAFYDFEGSRYLVGVSNGKIKYKSGSSWSDITGSLSPTTGQNVLTRFSFFHDGTYGNLIGADNSSNPWYWPGTGNALALPLTLASDICPFKQHLFAINTAARATAIQFAEAGIVTSWPDENVFDPTRDSAGVGLSLHNAETMLAFYERSVHKINFNYGAAGALSNLFTTQLVDGSRGCRARNSIVTYKGKTYFASDDGIYEVGDPAYPAKYISRPLENLWGGLLRSRLPYLNGFARGEPWNEIVWLANDDTSTTNNLAIVYNPVIAQMYGNDAGWSIFNSDNGYLKFNCGTSFIDSDGVHRSILGDYNGYACEAWGTEKNAVQFTDGPTEEPVGTTFETGYFDCGYEGVKGARELWVDLELFDDRTFSILVDTTNSSVTKTASAAIGAPADLLGDDFILGESYLAGSGIATFARQLAGNGRYFRVRLTESDDGIPHYLNAIHLLFTRKGLRER